MVFQDAELYLGPEANIPVAFDNLIHKGDMPLTIGAVCQPRRTGPGYARLGRER